jgi:hypothetical protein
MALALAACAGSSDENTTSTAASTDTTATAAEVTTTTARPETTTTAAPETTTSVSGDSASSNDDCLVGTWTLDTEDFVENFGPIFEQSGMPDTKVTALDGTFTVELGADGSLSGTRDDWGFNIATGEGTVTLEINGRETGTWSADGSTLTIDIDESDLTVNSSIEVDGQVIEMPQDQIPVETPPGIASNSQYTCAGDVLTLTNAGVESVLNRS